MIEMLRCLRLLSVPNADNSEPRSSSCEFNRAVTGSASAATNCWTMPPISSPDPIPLATIGIFLTSYICKIF